MAIAVDSTVSGTSSNSYASVAEADGYFETILWYIPTWAGYTEDQKEARLINATRLLDSWKYRSSKYVSTQALEFPRLSQTYPATIPEKVKQAQLELIIYRDQKLGATSGALSKEIEAVRIEGTVSVQFSKKDINTIDDTVQDGSLARVRSLLRDWLVGFNSVPVTGRLG